MATKKPNDKPVFDPQLSGQRRWYNNMPTNIQDPDYIVSMYDFLDPAELDAVADTGDGTGARLNWTVTSDASATAAITADEKGGAVTLSGQATTDDSGNLMQSIQENYKLDGGDLWFEAKVKTSDADDQDVFVGLATDASITNPEDVLAEADRIGFQINDGDASILCKAEKNGSESSEDSGEDAADATYVKLGFHYSKRDSKVRYYVNRELAAEIESNIPDDTEMGIALFQLSGSDSGTKTLIVDYVMVVQERE